MESQIYLKLEIAMFLFDLLLKTRALQVNIRKIVCSVGKDTAGTC